MTKKSAGRLMRDAENKKKDDYLGKNTCWDDLNKIYSEMVLLLAKNAEIVLIGENKELVAAMADPILFADNTASLAKDLTKLNGELVEIHNNHAGKIGGITNPDDHWKTIEIFEAYALFMERFNGVVMPTVEYILDQTHHAEIVLASRLVAKADAVADDSISVGETKPIDDARFSGVVINNETSVVDSPVITNFDKLSESFKALHPEQSPVIGVTSGDLKDTKQGVAE